MAKLGRVVDMGEFNRLSSRGRVSKWRSIFNQLEDGRPQVIQLEKREKVQAARIALSKVGKDAGYKMSFRMRGDDLLALKERA